MKFIRVHLIKDDEEIYFNTQYIEAFLDEEIWVAGKCHYIRETAEEIKNLINSTLEY